MILDGLVLPLCKVFLRFGSVTCACKRLAESMATKFSKALDSGKENSYATGYISVCAFKYAKWIPKPFTCQWMLVGISGALGNGSGERHADADGAV